LKQTHRKFKDVIWQVVPLLLAAFAVAGSAYCNTAVDLSTLMPNPSFELGNQPTAPGNQVGCPVGWTCNGSPAPGGTSYAPSNAQYAPGSDGLPGSLVVPDGTQAGQCPTLIAGSCTLYALNLGAYQANTTYNLSLWVGTPLTMQNCGGTPGCVTNVSLAYPVSRVTAYWLGNGNSQLQATNIPVPAPGQWQKVPLSFTPVGYQIGQTISFLLFASTSQGYQQVNFDVELAVTLNCPPVTSGLVGTFYSESFSVSGGIPPYGFDIEGVPTNFLFTSGLNFAFTGGTLKISGTPVVAGQFTITGNADGTRVASANSCTQTFVVPAP
jgi:hypothetical protein